MQCGTFQGKTWTEADLDTIVKNYGISGSTEAPLVVDHDETGEKSPIADHLGPSFGWTADLKRVGTDLYAKLKDVTDAAKALIRKKLYKKISPAIYFNFEGRGPSLKHISMLGARIPQIKTLQDIRMLSEAEIVAYAEADGFTAGPISLDPVIVEFGELGDFIRRRLSTRNMEVQEFASAIGVAADTASAILSGDIERPPDSRLRRIATAIGVSFQTLLNLVPSARRREGREEMSETRETTRTLVEMFEESQQAQADAKKQEDDLIAAVKAGKEDPDAAKKKEEAELAEKKKKEADEDPEIAALKKEVATLTKANSDRVNADKRETVDAFCETMVKTKKMLPREVDAAKISLMAADNMDVVEYGELKTTAYEVLKKSYEQREVHTNFDELATSKTDKKPTGPVEEKQAEMLAKWDAEPELRAMLKGKMSREEYASVELAEAEIRGVLYQYSESAPPLEV